MNEGVRLYFITEVLRILMCHILIKEMDLYADSNA